MRKPVIAGNWKMYKLIAEAVATAVELKPLVSNANHCEVVVAPVFTALKTVADRLEGSNVRVAGQDCSTESKHGAHTGEVAADMLKDAGASHVIVGHSERRQFYHETDKALQRKVPAALEAGLTPILCVGESEEERERGDTERKLRTQVREALHDVPTERLHEVVIAYEPIWAIGTGKVATAEQAQEACAFCRALVADRSQDAGERIRVQYGGSMKPGNAAELLALPDVDGGLVGGASLEPDDFLAIVDAVR